MSNFRQGRYSWLIKPISYTVDLVVINSVALLWLLPQTPPLKFILTISVGWITTAIISRFYEVHRYSNVVRVLNLLVRQGLFFSLLIS